MIPKKTFFALDPILRFICYISIFFSTYFTEATLFLFGLPCSTSFLYSTFSVFRNCGKVVKTVHTSVLRSAWEASLTGLRLSLRQTKTVMGELSRVICNIYTHTVSQPSPDHNTTRTKRSFETNHLLSAYKCILRKFGVNQMPNPRGSLLYNNPHIARLLPCWGVGVTLTGA